MLHLTFSCLTEDPTERISAKAALQHKFFSDHELIPSLKDMVLLPTNVLRLLNVLDDPKYKNNDEVKGKVFIYVFWEKYYNVVNKLQSFICFKT